MAIPLTIRRLLTIRGVELPVFHPIALKLQHLLERTDFKMDEVLALATEDPSVAGQILRMANSLGNIGRVRTETVKDAVIRLGAHRVANIAMAASQAGLHTSESKVINGFMQKLWVHSHACATGCRWLAIASGRPQVAEQAYMGGLLHDVGKLHLLKALERLNERGVAQSALEEAMLLEIFEELHVEQGESVMKEWNLPKAYCKVVEQHHLERYDTSDAVTALVRVVNCACHYRGIGLFHDRFLNLSILPETERLALSDQNLRELCGVLDESLHVTGAAQERVLLKRSSAQERIANSSMNSANS
ncbi:HDOD domain-containing protein [Geomonas sp. RF6]|uniref:HDOD domain-containing protein n=1 Tax=Geomonas sp. RF6 TaxID=2897342 RepID=UPI001E50898A|nr:HDOD domain-containing protein [Geomonas sp. RF6]UFS71000.1 HDOD domain-containing protein [Geomonas sp. RF6]